MEDKGLFINLLNTFYRRVVHNARDIADMDYVREEYDEYVVVKFANGLKKKFCITADSEEDILIDFANFLNHFEEFEYI